VIIREVLLVHVLSLSDAQAKLVEKEGKRVQGFRGVLSRKEKTKAALITKLRICQTETAFRNKCR
jgi:hypothetical protein